MSESETTVTWTRGESEEFLRAILRKASTCDVSVVAVYKGDDYMATVEAVPQRRGWVWKMNPFEACHDSGYIHQDLQTVTAIFSRERPEWLPEDAEEGDWLTSPGYSIRQWRDGQLWFIDGDEDQRPHSALIRQQWTIWEPWAEVKAERARLRAEVERLSTVTDEMVEAAFWADYSFDSREPVRRALEEALAVRDGGES